MLTTNLRNYVKLNKNQAKYIYNIYCISNSIILTAANDSRITKTDVNKKIYY